mmetsp:Transcript_49454/g.115638  ORF Transcript_49454/g.115638 Transcript_49454/m.115638 type:complete len:487 (-) Transcript_49454:67-1527(-)
MIEEQTPEEHKQNSGPLVYQETKVFLSELALISVYDNNEARTITMKFYGLDTQDALQMQYTYDEFDALFRFNATLMNPNRKEGRFHWVIERLEVSAIGGVRRMQLATEPTTEVPELPIYETERKIPTGRMDLKERQRLREQMDMLSIKRDENIVKKKAVSKAKFLEKYFADKKGMQEKEKQAAERLSDEKLKHLAMKEEMDKKAEELRVKNDDLHKFRMVHVQVKEERTAEAEEESLRAMRARWKTADAEKARTLAEVRQRKERERSARRAEEDAEASRLGTAKAKREAQWQSRELRVKDKQRTLITRIMEVKAARQRATALARERNQEAVVQIHKSRQPIFRAQLDRTLERQRAREAEAAAVADYEDKRAIPKKAKTKGKYAKGKGKPEGEEGHEPPADENKDEKEVLVDAVEIKMRAEMEEQRRRADLDKLRNAKILEKERERQTKEEEHMKEVRERFRQMELEKAQARETRRLVATQRAQVVA